MHISVQGLQCAPCTPEVTQSQSHPPLTPESAGSIFVLSKPGLKALVFQKTEKSEDRMRRRNGKKKILPTSGSPKVTGYSVEIGVGSNLADNGF